MDLDKAISIIRFIAYTLASIFFVKWAYYSYKNAKLESIFLDNTVRQQEERFKRIKRFRDDFYDEG